MNALEQAIKIVGRANKLAAACKVKPQNITRWRRQGFPPVNYVLTIESATDGQITRHQLRPDIYPAGDFNQPNSPIPTPSSQPAAFGDACSVRDG